MSTSIANRIPARSLRPINILHEDLQLPFRQVAQIAGVNESTLHRWRAGRSTPSPTHERTLRALNEFITEFIEMFGTGSPEGRTWLTTPIPALGNLEPLDLLLAGKIERVSALLGRANRGEAA